MTSHQKEYIVTGHLKETNGKEKQTYILHRSIFSDSKDNAINHFKNHFFPDLELIKIFSVTDHNGNQI
jgi:hypothetical protein